MWRVFNGRSVLSAEGAAFKRNAAWLARDAGARCTNGDIEVSVTLHPRTTKSGASSAVVIDLDNSLKCVCDALQGVAFVNDKQIKRLSAAYGAPMPDGGITVRVTPMQTEGA